MTTEKRETGGTAETPRCGLCGKTEKLTRTPCCGNWICDDADKYVPFSYARNSCFRNHSMFTICGSHFHAGHQGRWQDCALCREMGPLELYVEHATNEYNFEKLEKPPTFEPTSCADCGVVINLTQDAYSMRGGKYFCDACSGIPAREVYSKVVKQPPGGPMASLPVRYVGKSGAYPAATIAYYGPDNTLATKVAVTILRSPVGAPAALHRWITHTGDIRHDAAIQAEVEAFLKKHRVKQQIITERIIGCPHEEGKDYPMGGVCPHCPFWHNRDRFTHELLPPPPEMTPAHILSELAEGYDHQPREALLAADAHREALTEPLLHAIEHGIANAAGATRRDVTLFTFAAYLLAKWRETRAYPLFMRWFSLPDEEPFDLGGDAITEDGKRFLASVCGGDLAPIKALIQDRNANEYCRGEAIEALAVLVAWQELPQQETSEYLTWLANEGLEREVSMAWNNLAISCMNIEALGAFHALRQAYDNGWIAPFLVSPDSLDDVERGPRGRSLAGFREAHPPISDVIQETAWQFFEETKDEEFPAGREMFPRSTPPIPEPYRAAPKVGRNDPCPCGSGKKYKKCCGK